jgi:phosphatidylglycerol:prolipoprotein diacylglycerol transferase
VPIFVFEFDPLVRLGDLAIRWEAIGIAGSILLALVLAAILSRRGGPGRGSRTQRYRADDLLYIALGAVPGAVVGGRLGYVLLHLDYYGADPGAILDPAQGGLQLSLAVLGGTLTGGYVASLVGASVRGWMHVAALPLLLAIEGGKAAMAWGGSGQGVAASDLPRTAYLGSGPWGSLGPSVPSVPSQLLEAGAVALVGVLLVAFMAAGGFQHRDGRLYLAAVALWLAARLVIAMTWRDPAEVGPLNVDQVVSVVLLGAVALAWFVVGRRAGAETAATQATDGPAWPDETSLSALRRPEPASAPTRTTVAEAQGEAPSSEG